MPISETYVAQYKSEANPCAPNKNKQISGLSKEVYEIILAQEAKFKIEERSQFHFGDWFKIYINV